MSNLKIKLLKLKNKLYLQSLLMSFSDLQLKIMNI